LKDTDYVYVWVDGIHLKVRLEADKVCLLVMIGVRADGTKELVALADGFRESTESWVDLLRSRRRRGIGRTPGIDPPSARVVHHWGAGSSIDRQGIRVGLCSTGTTMRTTSGCYSGSCRRVANGCWT
jgi:hypothetical protein